MPYLILIVFLSLVILYLVFHRINNFKNFEDEEFPEIDINSIDLEKSASRLSDKMETVKKTNIRRKLNKSLDWSYRIILYAYDYIDRDMRNKTEIIPAAEWLLDNLYFIEKEYKDIKHNMPVGYYNYLPVIKQGVMKGFPRIYQIALKIVCYTDGRIDEDITEKFIRAYQENDVLTNGEIWALPLMLRIGLIHNISKAAETIVFAQKERNKANITAEKIIHMVNEKSSEDTLYVLFNEEISFSPHFTERLLKILRDNGIENSEVYRWIDEKLQLQNSSTEKMINNDHQKQASMQLSMGNCINGMKEIEALDWRDFFERTSCVEAVLMSDPADIYVKMEFASKDYYRHKIEKLSEYMGISEVYIARKAVECALDADPAPDREYLRHVGYYLIDDGVDCLKKKIGYKARGVKKIFSFPEKHKVFCYIGIITAGTVLLSLTVIILSLLSDYRIIFWKYIIAAAAIIIPCSEIVISVMNWSINQLTEPDVIPKMEFEEGIPREYSAAVVIPTILNSEKRVHNIVNDLEVYYLANSEKNLFFVLLGDLKDSSREEEESDAPILNCAVEAVRELNQKYFRDKEERFYFFNRKRLYNPKENKWMGWERKRGKLQEFNWLIRGGTSTYTTFSSNPDVLKRVRFVITLDTDTELTRGTAKRLIGAMAHVLNKAEIDKENNRIIRGYGVLQPRVSVGISSAGRTFFSRIFSGETGVDIYTTAVSDVYQDLFREGIFTGKGIYDVDVFNIVLKDRIPDNTLLSHDLLEGCFTRAGLVTDIELIDGYPAYYNSSSKRLHRWVRGDWQLLPWLIDSRNSLNPLSRWKILDNMRRSLLAPSIITLIVLSVTVLPNGMEKWFIIAFVALMCPVLFNVSENVIESVGGISLSERISSVRLAIEQLFLIYSFLPYQTYLISDAVIRTLFRVLASRKKLLEWVTAADVEMKIGRSVVDFIREMWSGSIISLFLLLLAFSKSFETGVLLLPSCIIWFISPLIAFYISRDRIEKSWEPAPADTDFIRRISRKTWAYFEDFVNEENGWLAPDNFQEKPYVGVACRTSPTNLGMGLISNICAADMGYIGLLEMLQRIEHILESMESLEKYKGHFLNWYDTKNSQPLYPRYVSTVDSGNLVGYLWTISESLNNYLKEPILKERYKQGLRDALVLAEEEISNSTGIKDVYADIIREAEIPGFNLTDWREFLLKIEKKIAELEKENMGLYWNGKIKNTVNKFKQEIQLFFKWTDIFSEKTPVGLEIKSALKISGNSVNLENYKTDMKKISAIIANEKELSKENTRFYDELESSINESIDEIDMAYLILKKVKNKLEKMSDSTDFSILYNKSRSLFSIAFDLENNKLINCYYDLLASEARQASFTAIAKGDVNQDHWFKLGRAMTIIGKNKGLVSWTGTMFEYFMPLLIMKAYPGTILGETYKAVIEGQKKYCSERNVPWGISESAFYSFDVNFIYQYKAFGVPGIGLKRGLGNELVIAPYASLLTLPVNLRDSVSNLKKLSGEGMEGRYGFYEAADYTKSRLQKGNKKAVIKCFMVHHIGMSLMALDNRINDNILQRRFHNIPRVKATEFLLQEKIPKRIVYEREQKFHNMDTVPDKQNIIARNYDTPLTELPETHMLSNGSFSTMISNSGSGYSKKNDIALYRWKEDVTLDNYGMYFYIKDKTSSKYWSAAYDPCKVRADKYTVRFSLHKAEFERRDSDIVTHTEITVSNEDDAEIRRINITNNSKDTKIIEVTSYLEVTLATFKSDIVHPAFGNLFVSTEFVDNPQCLIANRRTRTKEENPIFLMQTVVVEGEPVGSLEYETSRVNFIGRNRNIHLPEVIDKDMPLKNTSGIVLDPVISLRRSLKISSGGNCRITYITAVSSSKDELIETAVKYRETNNIKRAFELSLTQSQLEMKYMGIKSSQANLYQLMASRILFLNASFQDRANYIQNIKKGQRALWPYGISGDLPVVLSLVKKDSDVDMVRQLLKAHEYWALKGLKVDLVIISEQKTAYMQPLLDSLRDIISSSYARDKINKSGGIFLYSANSMNVDDINLLKAISRLVIDSDNGLIITQIKKANKKHSTIKNLKTKMINYKSEPFSFEEVKLLYFNEIGGFDSVNNEYRIILKDSRTTPAPWINIISNGKFGFQISESGASSTWYLNSRENKLSTWSNDWVTDFTEECLYIRDEITGEAWTITPEPVRKNTEYIICHGHGYTVFKSCQNGIIGEETVFVPMNDNVKICTVKLKNNTDIERNLSLTYYAQIVLGVVPQQTAQYISTYLNKEKKYIAAKNPYSESFGRLICFLKIYGVENQTFTGSRSEFLGRCGNTETPEALKKKLLSDTVGSGYDPCLCEQIQIHLKPGEERTLYLLFGEEESEQAIDKLLNKYESMDNVYNELKKVKTYWRDILQSIKVDTPDMSMNLLLNGWLLYQTIACRLWSRTAFYQSGGAFGFRDQLQDTLSLLYIKPEIAKNQILNSASRQFLEGDVQHWWHPIINCGIRTRFSDDLLWLAYVTSEYIKSTGDFSILDEEVHYLEGDPLKEGTDEKYTVSRQSEIKGTIYEHCIKALERGIKFGPHNIPLMGSGDWNDGMNTVGNKGTGESVWLGWFLYRILKNFLEIFDFMKDKAAVEKYSEVMEFIRVNLENNAWDGNWYRRAYFDDMTPLGSIENEECQIDSISQSWAVISEAADKEKADAAMNALEKYLVKYDRGMILLLTPPFDKSKLEPGYIKGYVPGVRENGGQYTHAAVWAILAMVKKGEKNKAWKLYNMINPVNHTKSYYECETYKVEPYVMAADVYAREPHAGRGGWSWYTGAAGWMYKAGVEGILGLKLEGGKGFKIEPCIPDHWPGFSMEYRKDNVLYKIKVEKGNRKSLFLDGSEIKDGMIPFFKEGEHFINLTIND